MQHRYSRLHQLRYTLNISHTHGKHIAPTTPLLIVMKCEFRMFCIVITETTASEQQVPNCFADIVIFVEAITKHTLKT